MSALEVITEIKKLSPVQRQKVFEFVAQQLRQEEDRIDNERADSALKESGENILWSEARQQLGWG